VSKWRRIGDERVSVGVSLGKKKEGVEMIREGVGVGKKKGGEDE